MTRFALMLSALVMLCSVGAIGEPPAETDRPVIKVWPDGPPAVGEPIAGEKLAALEAKTTSERIAVVTDPTLTLYRAPADRATGAAIIVCPGGGYNILAWPKEGLEVAEWLNGLGVTALVLKYRVPRRLPDQPHLAPLQDVQRALRLTRANAEPWGVDPKRLGVLGFSAGGHLTVMAATKSDEPAYEKIDAVDEQSCRPDFVVPIYAAYLGAKDDAYKLDESIRITKQAPPMFMAVTLDDQHRGVHAGLMLAQYKKAGVPAEAHIFASGGHGYGLRATKPVKSWPRLCAMWLEDGGWLKQGE